MDRLNSLPELAFNRIVVYAISAEPTPAKPLDYRLVSRRWSHTVMRNFRLIYHVLLENRFACPTHSIGDYQSGRQLMKKSMYTADFIDALDEDGPASLLERVRVVRLKVVNAQLVKLMLELLPRLQHNYELAIEVFNYEREKVDRFDVDKTLATQFPNVRLKALHWRRSAVHEATHAGRSAAVMRYLLAGQKHVALYEVLSHADAKAELIVGIASSLRWLGVTSTQFAHILQPEIDSRQRFTSLKRLNITLVDEPIDFNVLAKIETLTEVYAMIQCPNPAAGVAVLESNVDYFKPLPQLRFLGIFSAQVPACSVRNLFRLLPMLAPPAGNVKLIFCARSTSMFEDFRHAAANGWLRSVSKLLVRASAKHLHKLFETYLTEQRDQSVQHMPALRLFEFFSQAPCCSVDTFRACQRSIQSINVDDPLARTLVQPHRPWPLTILFGNPKVDYGGLAVEQFLEAAVAADVPKRKFGLIRLDRYAAFFIVQRRFLPFGWWGRRVQGLQNIDGVAEVVRSLHSRMALLVARRYPSTALKFVESYYLDETSGRPCWKGSFSWPVSGSDGVSSAAASERMLVGLAAKPSQRPWESFSNERVFDAMTFQWE